MKRPSFTIMRFPLGPIGLNNLFGEELGECESAQNDQTL